MRVEQVILYKTPFDGSYSDVFDAYDDTVVGEYYDRFNEVFNKHYEPYIIDTFTPFSIPLNITISFTIRVRGSIIDDIDISLYNYAILRSLRGDNAYYFISGYTVNNSVDVKSITFNCVKDVWTTYYPKILNSIPLQKIERRHFNNWDGLVNVSDTALPDIKAKISERFYSDEPASGLVYEATSPNAVETKFDILWIRYFIDGNKRWRVGDFELKHLSGLSTSIYCVYRPVIVYMSGTLVEYHVEEIFDNPLIGDSLYLSNNVNFTYNMDSSYLVGVDLTFNAPFTLSVKNALHPWLDDCNIGYLQVYDEVNGWTNVGNGFVACYTGDKFDTRTLDFTSLFENDSTYYSETDISLNDYGTPKSIRNLALQLAELKCPPYYYYSLKTPLNTIPLSFQGKINSLFVNTKISEFGASNRYYCVTPYGNFLNNYFNIEDVSNTSDLPYTLSSYERFKSTGQASFNVRYQNALESNLVQRRVDQADNLSAGIKGYRDMNEGAARFIAGDVAGGATEFLSGKQALKQTPMKMIRTQYLSEVGARQIKRSRDAEMEDIIRRPSSVFNISSTGFGDIKFQDRCVLYVNKPIKTEEYYSRAYELIKYGTPRICLDNIFRNTRKCYDFVKTQNANINGVTGINERDSLEAIFNMGVRRWHLGVISTSSNFYKTLNPLITNPPQNLELLEE